MKKLIRSGLVPSVLRRPGPSAARQAVVSLLRGFL